jgi:hypothetical protein
LGSEHADHALKYEITGLFQRRVFSLQISVQLAQNLQLGFSRFKLGAKAL